MVKKKRSQRPFQSLAVEAIAFAMFLLVRITGNGGVLNKRVASVGDAGQGFLDGLEAKRGTLRRKRNSAAFVQDCNSLLRRHLFKCSAHRGVRATMLNVPKLNHGHGRPSSKCNDDIQSSSLNPNLKGQSALAPVRRRGGKAVKLAHGFNARLSIRCGSHSFARLGMLPRWF